MATAPAINCTANLYSRDLAAIDNEYLGQIMAGTGGLNYDGYWYFDLAAYKNCDITAGTFKFYRSDSYNNDPVITIAAVKPVAYNVANPTSVEASGSTAQIMSGAGWKTTAVPVAVLDHLQHGDWLALRHGGSNTYIETYGIGKSSGAYTPTLTITYSYPMKVKVGGSWKNVIDRKIKVGGSWKTIVTMKVKVGGTWKTVM